MRWLQRRRCGRVQGFSTGMPERLQLQMLHTLPGLQECRMLRPAYAVEYDYLPAYQCHSTLETKRVGNLFFSGQLNGTTGARPAQHRRRTGPVQSGMSRSSRIWHCECHTYGCICLGEVPAS